MSDTLPENAEHIENLPIIEEMQDSYLRYSMSVIMSRALPDVRDGLKPSQRRILVAANDLNLGPRSHHRKCAKIAGATSGNYHPHGESVIYPTLVRMGQPFSMRYRLIDGQGNFGSIDGDPPAAMRYTEARLTAPAMEMLADIKLDTVDFHPTDDETRTEPMVLPGKLPNLLVNGSTGIAVGMATNLAPHNLGEVCDAINLVLDNPDCTLAELMEVLPGPDFPTNGQICGRRGVVDAYTTGRGSITMRGKMHLEETKRGRRRIVIDEIPYAILKQTIRESIVNAVKNGNLSDVAVVNDESDRRNPIRLVVDLKRDANPDVVMNQIFQYTPMQSNFNAMNVALANRQPRTLSMKEKSGDYMDHRKVVIRRRTSYLWRRAQQRAHVLEGLILAVGDIDAIIKLIREAPDPPTAKKRLAARPLRLSESAALRKLLPEAFIERASASDQYLTAVQADAILAMQLQRLTGLEIEKLAKEYTDLSEKIAEYRAILADENLVIDIIRTDLKDLKDKYGDARRTEIIEAVDDFRIEELIPDEQTLVTVSHEG